MFYTMKLQINSGYLYILPICSSDRYHTVSTLSEAMQEKFGRKDCPYLYDCGIAVTKDFFSRVCKSPGYINCHHFAKRVGELKTPLTWLQKMAVDQAKMMTNDIEATQF